MSVTYEITEKAVAQLSEVIESMDNIQKNLGIPQSELYSISTNRINSNKNPTLILLHLKAMLGFGKGDSIHTLGVVDEIEAKKLESHIDNNMIKILEDGGYLIKKDPDDDFLDTIREAFGMYFWIKVDTPDMITLLRDFPQEIKNEIAKIDARADDDRDYPCYLYIREIVLRQLEVIKLTRTSAVWEGGSDE